MSKLPDDLTTFSHELLQILQESKDDDVSTQAKQELSRRYENRLTEDKNKEYIASLKATLYIRLQSDDLDGAKKIVETELSNYRHNFNTIILQSPDPRVLDVSVVLGSKVPCIQRSRQNFT